MQRIAEEGVISANMAEDGSACVLLELNCETDFVAKTSDLHELAGGISDVMHTLVDKSKSPIELPDYEVLEQTSIAANNVTATISSHLVTATTRLGESVRVSRLTYLPCPPNGLLSHYVHNAFAGQQNKVGKNAAAIALSIQDGAINDSNRVRLEETARMLAKQVVAMSPLYSNQMEVPKDVLEQQRQIVMAAHLAQQEANGKEASLPPKEILDKIVQGKIAKIMKEEVLSEQEPLLRPEEEEGAASTVRVHLERVAKECGVGGIKIEGFASIGIGVHRGR